MTLEEVRARHEEAKRMYGSNLNTAERDREFLLAEVDRLTLVAMDEGPYLDGQRHERARIRAAVEGLPECFHMSEDHDDHMTLDRAAVLAAIEGAEHD